MDRMTSSDYSKLKQKLEKKLKGYRAIVLYCNDFVGKLAVNTLLQ
jgi:hypothetical protein